MTLRMTTLSVAALLFIGGCEAEPEADADALIYEVEDMERDNHYIPPGKDTKSWCECCDIEPDGDDKCVEVSCSSSCIGFDYKQECSYAADNDTIICERT